MENSANLLLPYIMPSQAQKHVTHNEAIQALDALVQIAIASRDETVPPNGPPAGARYIVAEMAIGAWAGKAGKIAAWQDGAWNFHTPREGWVAWCIADSEVLVFTQGGWARLVELIDPSGLPASLPQLGINATADGANRLSVKANGTLLSHDGGDHRLTLNKESAVDTASMIFQNDWSGHAEMGLAGSNDFSLRVSADGTTFIDAITVDRQTGIVQMPATAILTDHSVNLLQDSGRFAGNGINSVTIGSFSFPGYLTTINGSTTSGLAKFIYDNNDYGGSGGTLNASVKGLIDKIRDSAYRRYGIEFWIAQIVQGSGTAGAVTHLGQTYYEALYSAQRVRLPNMTFHAYIRAVDDSILVRHVSGLVILKDGATQSGTAMITPADGWVSLTIFDRLNPRTSYGYTPATFDVYGKTSGNRWQLACPALIGGITPVDDNVGIMPAFNGWVA